MGGDVSFILLICTQRGLLRQKCNEKSFCIAFGSLSGHLLYLKVEVCKYLFYFYVSTLLEEI